MSLPFKVKFPMAGKCPGCKKELQIGDTALFESKNWPWDDHPIGVRPEDLRKWHSVCVNVALVDSLCPQCSLLHKDHGMCLI